MHILNTLRNEEGVALLMVLLVAVVVGALSLTAVVVGGNASLISMYEERQDQLEAIADAGLERGRAVLNGTQGLFPDSGYVTVENGVNVFDASGVLISGVRRTTYVGPVGSSTGQHGIFGGVVSIAEAPNGDRVIRRSDLTQESFAKYAYFTDVEPSNIAFGSGDVITGPVHTNDFLKIYPSRATFRGPGSVTTARTISGREYGTFVEGYEENVGRIEMPQTAELSRLRALAARGGTAFNAPSGGNSSEARLRIEFIAIDLNGDGQMSGDDEGFFRVYQSHLGDWMMAYEPGLGWPSSQNCGYPSGNQFITPFSISGNNSVKRAAMMQSNSRCYLGGAPELYGGTFTASDAKGAWVQRPFSLTGSPPAALTGRPDYEYLFPLGRSFNPDFKGVIHVTGRVAVSGTLRGRLTLAATGDIFIVDDVRYVSTPGSGSCQDILGLFSGGDVRVADNGINTPQRPDVGLARRSYDDTKSEFIDAVVLSLSNFTVDNYASGPSTEEPCEGTTRGRGCLYLSGGIIQRERGGVGTTGGTGYLKRYSYDQCALSNPPPYFPTTGRFSKLRYLEVDPLGFEPGAYFARFTAGS